MTLPSNSSSVWFSRKLTTNEKASSGLGLSLAEHVLSRNETAIATCRDPLTLKHLESRYLKSGKLLIIRLDVTKREEVSAAFEQARKVYGRIDIVYNNAGIGAAGEIESTPNEFARGMFETNFWGAVNVTRCAVSFFREINRPRGGRLIQVSSMLGLTVCSWERDEGGFMALASLVSVSTSINNLIHALPNNVNHRAALEGITEALVQELDHSWNIKVTLVEAGYFRTMLAAKSAGKIPAHPAYTQVATSAGAPILVGDPDKHSQAIFRLAALENPPLRLVLGKDARENIREKLNKLSKEFEECEDWSDDLALNEAHTRSRARL
ncbi:hypothetical protein AX16_001525 [Volvariella volvacea WC 439]|nr:hypothetical protein AX16_001525 [Volvariella volvacea WC 439]